MSARRIQPTYGMPSVAALSMVAASVPPENAFVMPLGLSGSGRHVALVKQQSASCCIGHNSAAPCKGVWNHLSTSFLTAVTAAAVVVAGRRRHRQLHSHKIARRFYVSGCGWTDEIARIFDPRPEGPEWQKNLGYRGRKKLRILLDGEDLVHSYSKAAHERWGKWTGPRSEGIFQALAYGAWRGFGPGEGKEIQHDPDEPCYDSPEIMTFVAMPAEYIEAVDPSYICDGYPEDLREKIGRCSLSEKGYFVNKFILSLQDAKRLITWARPPHFPGGAPRPNSLLAQKYYRKGEPIVFRSFQKTPFILAQVMGAGNALRVGDRVEALREGRVVRKAWLPTKWMKADVVAVNYDGTYDLRFKRTFGPFHENKKTGLRKRAPLSLKRNMIYWKFGADNMPAEFRFMMELNYAQAVPADQIRLPGQIERISDFSEMEQDWYLVSSKRFALGKSAYGKDVWRLKAWEKQFQIGYKWVETEEGLRFEPVPTSAMAASITACHKGTAEQFSMIEDKHRQRLDRIKTRMEQLVDELEKPPKQKSERPKPAGPKAPEKKMPLLLENEDAQSPALTETAETQLSALADS